MAGNLVTFDIGQSQVKIVWYAGAVCRKAVAVALPDNMVDGGEILSMDAMADFLRACAKEHGIPRCAAAIILPASQVFTRNVDVPPMTDAQLQYNLPFEFKDYLTQEKSLYYFDYSVNALVSDESGDVSKMQLFACATLKKTIEDYREMLRRAGYRLKFAMPEESAYSALLAAHIRAGGDADADYCLVDLGFNAIRMHIFRGRTFMTRRTISLGQRDLVQVIADARDVDEHMAQEHILSNFENALTEQVSLDLFRRMSIEIMKAVNFYNYNNRERTLDRIYLCGGGSAIGQIADAISDVTKLEVRSISDLMHMDAAQDAPWLVAKAVGCALQR